MAKAKNYEGFGEVHGLREWARLLGANKDTLRYWLTTKELTVEEFAKQNGLEYKPQIDAGRETVNRLAQAEELLRQLFDRSGYDAELMECRRRSGARTLQVLYAGGLVGTYYLDTGALKLGRDEGINLIEYPVPDPKIFHYAEGWGAHPNTRSAVVRHVMASVGSRL